MRRVKVLSHLLVLGILLATFHHHCAIICKVHAMRPAVDSKLRHHNSRLTTGYISTTWVKDNKIGKRPSAPNPVGNHRPPSRP